jgi:hypothetical protein
VEKDKIFPPLGHKTVKEYKGRTHLLSSISDEIK